MDWTRLCLIFFILAGRIGLGEGEPATQDWLDYGRVAYCIGVAGHSVGVHHFCKDCDTVERVGIAMYWADPHHGAFPFFANQHNRNPTSKTFTKISVTGIEVGGRRLDGWFHIKLTFPPTSYHWLENPTSPGFRTDPVPVIPYAFIIQIEDDTNFRPIGEFTTDLLSKCDGIDAKSTPTLYQILPCHSVAPNQAQLSNVVVYWREADLKKGIIRTDNLTELRVNWRLPPSFGCGFANRFFIRADILTIPLDKLGHPVNIENCNIRGCDGQPHGHTSLVTRIHLPKMKLSGQFSGSEPPPPYVTGRVNCSVPIDVYPYANDTGIKNDTRTTPYVTQHDITFDECQDGQCNGSPSAGGNPNCHVLPIYGPTYATTPVACRPKGAYWNEGACTLGAGYYLNSVESDLLLEPQRPLYLGRCKYDPRKFNNGQTTIGFWVESNYFGAGSGILTIFRLNWMNTTNALECRPRLLGMDIGDDDNNFVNGLQSADDYLTALRFDICNCFPEGLDADGGAIKFEPPVTPSPSPRPDYPDVLPGARNAFQNAEIRAGSDSASPKNATPKPVKDLGDQVLDKIKLSHEMHAVLMTIAFMFIVPVGIFVVRYLKESFHGKTLLIFDVWYTLHVFSVMGTFAFLFWGGLMGYASEIWSQNVVRDDRLRFRSIIHNVIGYVVYVIFAVLVVTGGIRNYGSNSNSALICSIYFHTVLGYVFYLGGLIAMMEYCFVKSSEMDNLWYLAFGVCVARILIDIVFHIVMTLYQKKMDRQFHNLNRAIFPAMELIIDDQNAPGRKFRLLMFAVYVGLSLILTFLFSVFAVLAEDAFKGKIHFEIAVNRKSKNLQ